MNHYKTSKGERVSQGTINRNIRKAKEIKFSNTIINKGFISCEFTGQNSSSEIIDTMHIISVDQCKKIGRVELSWDQRNLRYGSRSYHEKFDNQSHEKRIEIFETLNNCKL